MQEVFERIKEFIYKEIDRTSSFIEHDTQCKILHFVEGLEEEYNNGWIPVEKRLPEDGVRVLVFIKALGETDNIHKDAMTVNWVKNGKFINCHNEGYRILAWQPLPPKYQPKGDKE